MQENNNTGFCPNKEVWYVTVCMLLVVMGIFLFRIDDSRLVSFLLLAGGLTAIRVLPFRRWTVLDICIGLITRYDLFSCLYAECPLPAIRVSFVTPCMRWWHILCFGSPCLKVGFEDTYHFRFLFRPLGYVTNVWSEILLLILGWACLSCRRYASVFIFLTFTVIFLSFSRGAYVASGISEK